MDCIGDLPLVLVRATGVDKLENAQFVSACQMQLQCLGQVGDLALFFRKRHGSAQVMSGKLIADKVDLFPDQLQKLHALLGCDEQVVQFNSGMVELA